MVTFVKQEFDDKMDKDTFCNPFEKEESSGTSNKKSKMSVCKEENLKKDSVVSDPVTIEQLNKVIKKSTQLKNIHNSNKPQVSIYFC